MRGVGGFALVVLSRWAANVQAFILLRKNNLLADAFGIARIGTELAILAAWALKGGAGPRFTTPAARVKALREDGNYSTRVWFDKMHELGAARGYDDATSWGRTLIAATDPGLPSVERMADCSTITKELYAFAYRGESGSVHSAARVLATNAAGVAPIREPLMLYNVLVAAFVIFDAAADMLDDDRARQMANQLGRVMRETATRRTGSEHPAQ